MRINKYIASSGVTSRRKADKLIAEGRVKVNGAVMNTPGYDVCPEDVVAVDGRVIRPEQRMVYLLMNKPEGYVTTVSDDAGRATVMDLLPPDIDERVFPVGRLDYNTSGLLLFTNDGELANRLTHPSHDFVKTYVAVTKGQPGVMDIRKLREGVDIGDDRLTAPAEVNVLKYRKNSAVVEIAIHEGRNRQVRRMFKAVGHPVMELKRISLGEIHLGHLVEGGVRKLRPQEISYLKNVK